MTSTAALPLEGTLGDRSLLNALTIAAARHAYCTVQIAGNQLSGEIQIANGAILIENAGDPAARQECIDSVFSLVRLSITQSGAFRLTPLTNMMNADATARLQISAAIKSATQPAGQPDPAVQPVPQPEPVAQVATTPASQPIAEAPVAAPTPAVSTAPAQQAPSTSTSHTAGRVPAPEGRRLRASQIRQILRDGGSISDYLPPEPVVEVADEQSPTRDGALRELITQLASN